MKKYLAAVAVFTLAAGSVGLAAPGALATTQSASALGKVAGTSSHTGVRAPLAPPPAASSPGWSIVPSPNPLARTGQLVGVSCSSSSSCTAVGDYTKRLGRTVTLAERWNGTSWSAESTPNPEGAPSSALNAVDCTSSSACVAVGNSFTRSGTEITLAERWDGTKWSLQPTPNPSSGGGILFGVSCSSASACTAVGASNAGTLAERWNGAKWLIQPTTQSPVGRRGSLRRVLPLVLRLRFDRGIQLRHPRRTVERSAVGDTANAQPGGRAGKRPVRGGLRLVLGL
jgi:hypothetical protein